MTPELLPQGFAAAVLPITAATITTDSAGLIAGEVEIPTGDLRIPAYRACPAQGESFPTILVVQEIFGIHEHIKDLCRRFAKLGYLAVAPYLYTREGEVAGLEGIPEIYAKVVSKVPDVQVMSDLDATVVWAAKNNGNTQRLAATGFCWGGRIVWLYAAHSGSAYKTPLKAGAAWYGRLAGATNPLQPRNPVDVASELKAPVIGLYGGKDTGISMESVGQMQALLEAADQPSEIHVFPHAQHGFNADYRPSYDPPAAKDAWAKMLAFFHEHGV